MTTAKKPDKYTEKQHGALLLSVAVMLKNLVYKGFAWLFLQKTAFYTFIWAALCATSTHSCKVAKILPPPEILILR